jgi:hypothetical protein
MAFRNAVNNCSYTTTENGALSYDGTGSAILDHFTTVMAREARAGKAAKGRNAKLRSSSAMSDQRIIELTSAAYSDSSKFDPNLFPRLLAHLCDCRGGKGERHAAGVAWRWWLENHPEECLRCIEHIPFYSRWVSLWDWFQGTAAEKTVVQLYAAQLRSDREHYTTALELASDILKATPTVENILNLANTESNIMKEIAKISLAAKWSPREGCYYDKRAIQLGSVRPSKLLADALSVTQRLYRTHYLAPLTMVTNTVEQKMCAGEWNSIDFSKVPSRALSIYSRLAFPKHAADAFIEWQEKVAAGKAKINFNQVDPYEIVNRYIQHDSLTASEIKTYEAFYTEHVRTFRDKYGEIDSVLVLADVSGSMSGTPMAVSVAMAIWISAVATEAWKDLFLTFESVPAFVDLSSSQSLEDRIKKALHAPWGGSTNLEAAFTQILKRAKEHNVSPEDMPKRLVIISDMQFNTATSWNTTNYQRMKDLYTQHNYELPMVIFWNVRGDTSSRAQPASSNDQGVIMVGGWSKDIMNMILYSSPIKTPLDAMIETLNNKRYDLMIAS